MRITYYLSWFTRHRCCAPTVWNAIGCTNVRERRLHLPLRCWMCRLKGYLAECVELDLVPVLVCTVCASRLVHLDKPPHCRECISYHDRVRPLQVAWSWVQWLSAPALRICTFGNSCEHRVAVSWSWEVISLFLSGTSDPCCLAFWFAALKTSCTSISLQLINSSSEYVCSHQVARRSTLNKATGLVTLWFFLVAALKWHLNWQFVRLVVSASTQVHNRTPGMLLRRLYASRARELCIPGGALL